MDKRIIAIIGFVFSFFSGLGLCGLLFLILTGIGAYFETPKDWSSDSRNLLSVLIFSATCLFATTVIIGGISLWIWFQEKEKRS